MEADGRRLHGRDSMFSAEGRQETMQNARSAAWKRACGGKHGARGGRRHGGFLVGEFVGGAFALRKRPSNASRVRTGGGGKSGFWFCEAPPVGFHFSPGRIPSVRLAGTARPTMGRTWGRSGRPSFRFAGGGAEGGVRLWKTFAFSLVFRVGGAGFSFAFHARSRPHGRAEARPSRGGHREEGRASARPRRDFPRGEDSPLRWRRGNR